jgi:hypothetical protein
LFLESLHFLLFSAGRPQPAGQSAHYPAGTLPPRARSAGSPCP